MKIVFFIFLIIILTSSCKIKEVEISKLSNFRLVNIGENKANIEFTVPVKNQNSFGFTISDINLDITLNNNKIGKVKRVNKIKIPAKSNQSYIVTMEIEIDKTVSSIPSLVASLMVNRIGIKTKGYVKVKKFIFSKKFSIDQHETIKLF